MRPKQKHRVISSRDLDGPGRDAAERAVRAGRWQRLAHGTYLTSADPPSHADLVAAARSYVRGPMVISGLLVLHTLGLPWLPPVQQVHVLVPPTNRQRSSGLVRVIRCSSFGTLATWTHFDVLLASPARALVDAARALSTLREVRGVVLGAVGRKTATPAALRTTLDAGQRNGSALTRRAIGDAERGCASPPEAELVDGLIGKGVPFHVNPELWLGDVLLGSPDVWLVGRNVGGEVESVEWHGDDEQKESTYDRHERITAPGIELVHLSVRRIRTDLDEAVEHLLGKAPRPAPAGLRVVPNGPLLQ